MLYLPKRISFILPIYWGGVIKGWQLGIPQIKPGGKVRLLIPSRYAYGPYAQDSIHLPANSVLDFQIQLYNVTN
ncbi:FKBP-type peptidyl-prolyl cis-trans isomerase [Mucilaginibacter sp. UC70_90]